MPIVAAISQADATVIAAAFTLAGVVYAGYRANKTNRREHAVNTGKLDMIIDRQTGIADEVDGIRREVHYIRTDVTDIHGAITELRKADHDTDARVTQLERKP